MTEDKKPENVIDSETKAKIELFAERLAKILVQQVESEKTEKVEGSELSPN